MDDSPTRGKTIGQRILIVAMMLAISASLPSTSVNATGGTTDGTSGHGPDRVALEAREVRTVWTNEYGLPRPAGLAYDPQRHEFLVAADQPVATPLLRLGPDAEHRGFLTLRPLRSAATLAFDAARNELVAIDGREAVRLPAASLAAPEPQEERVPIDGLRTNVPRSATFDPRAGTWFILDDGGVAALVPGGDRVRLRARISLVPSDADRLIAFHPADGLLYVLDPDVRRLDAVNHRGFVERRFSLGSIEMWTPVAMTFAPSTDSTDDPGNLNLYVADAGDVQTLGGVTELSLDVVGVAPAPCASAAYRAPSPVSVGISTR